MSGAIPPRYDERYGYRIPTAATLARYGLFFADWLLILDRQRGVCGVCGKRPESGRTVIDHEHVKGWKKMKPLERREYVRGICCISCNHFVLTRYATIEKHLRAARYLEAYEERRKLASQ